MRLVLRLVLFVVLAAIAMSVLKEAYPWMTESRRFWLTVSGLGVVFWLTRKRKPAGDPGASPQPRLEELERKLASSPALKWPPPGSGKAGTGAIAAGGPNTPGAGQCGPDRGGACQEGAAGDRGADPFCP